MGYLPGPAFALGPGDRLRGRGHINGPTMIQDRIETLGAMGNSVDVVGAVVAELFTRETPLPSAARLAGFPPKKKIVILATTETHVLNALALMIRARRINAEVLYVLGNHNTLRPVAEHYGFEFRLSPTPPNDPAALAAHHRDVLRACEEGDGVFLARYIRFIPPEICERFPHHILNIHPSMLAEFPGAAPYHQAVLYRANRIGVTSHYAEARVDAGTHVDREPFWIGHLDEVDGLHQMILENREVDHAWQRACDELSRKGHVLVEERPRYRELREIIRRHPPIQEQLERAVARIRRIGQPLEAGSFCRAAQLYCADQLADLR